MRKPFHEQKIFDVMGKCPGLNYVCESDSEEEEAAFESGAELAPERLSPLSAGIRMRLYEAVVLLDSIGKALRQLAGNLDYTPAALPNCRRMIMVTNRDTESGEKHD